MSRSLLRYFIREQVGRNAHTLDDSPNTFKDFEDYDVDISPNVNGKYTLTMFFKGAKMGHSTDYSSYEEANHQSRMIIDSHRVKAMHSDG